MLRRRSLRVTIQVVALVSSFGVLTPATTFAQTQSVNLSWNPHPDSDVDRYRLYVGTTPSGQDAGVYTISAPQVNYAFAATPGVLYYFAISAVNSDGIEGARSETVSGAIPLLSLLANRTSTVGVPIVAVQLSAYDPDGGVVRFTHTGLPPGLVLDTVTGLITGTPLSTGTFDVTVFASDGVLMDSRSFDWTIRSPGSTDTSPRLSIASPTPGQSVLSSVTVSGTATDAGSGDEGIVRVTVNGQLANGGTVSGSGIANWSRTITVSGASPTIAVEAVDGAGNYAAEFFTVTLDVTAPSVVISSHTSGQTVSSSTITLSGTATDSGSGGNGISSVTVNGASASGGTATGNSSANWSRVLTLASGLNAVTVVATDGAGNARTESTTIRYSPSQITVTSLTSDRSSPQPPSTPIRFTATAAGGTAPYQFKWWVLQNGVWYVVQDWSNYATFDWRPTNAGTYTVAVWARNAGVTADASQALAQVSYTISSAATSTSTSGSTAPLSVSLTSDRSSPQPPSTPIRFTATAAGGTAPYQFKWFELYGGVWYVAQDWSSSSTLNWGPTTPGTYAVAVWVRNAGVTTDASQAMAQMSYVISTAATSTSTSGSTAPLSITSLTSDRSSPQPTSTSIRFAATAAGGTAPYQFKWWVLQNGVWYVVQDWSSYATFDWRPTNAGTYAVAVWARNAGVTADASQAMAQVSYVIATAATSTSTSGSTAPLSVTLTSDRSSPQPRSTSIRFTATAAGGTAPYQFKFWELYGGVWYIAQDWSSSATLNWGPTTPGTYAVAVWVRNAGVTADAGQAMAQMTYVISP